VSSKSPTYTAILCTYNSEETVLVALKAILNQSVKPNEIIIIDDCSQDATIEIIHNAIKSLTEVKLIKNEVNLGQSASRNKAAQIANSEILVFFDDDDISKPERAQAHIQMHLDSADISFVSSSKKYANGYSVDCINQNLSLKDLSAKDWVLKMTTGQAKSALKNLWVPCSTCAVNRTFFLANGGFDVEMRRLEDAEFFIRAAIANGLASWTSQNLVIRNASFANDKGGQIDTQFEKDLLKKHRNLLTASQYRNALSLSEVRSAYFSKQYLRFIFKVAVNPLLLINSISRSARFAKRVIHDLKKGHQ
jgi:glycosyltransferase involved in cell wall biosynthesis